MDLSAMRNFKDFLLLYNEISETCFRRCANSTINRELSNDEIQENNINNSIYNISVEKCVNNCAGKYVNANHRIMGVYVEVQSALVNRRMEEYNKTIKIVADSTETTEASVPVAIAVTPAEETVVE